MCFSEGRKSTRETKNSSCSRTETRMHRGSPFHSLSNHRYIHMYTSILLIHVSPLEVAERHSGKSCEDDSLLSNHFSPVVFSSPPGPGVTSTVSTSSPSCRDDILMTTELSAVSDTVSSSSRTRARGTGERRCTGEGGGTGNWEGQKSFVCYFLDLFPFPSLSSLPFSFLFFFIFQNKTSFRVSAAVWSRMTFCLIWKTFVRRFSSIENSWVRQCFHQSVET